MRRNIGDLPHCFFDAYKTLLDRAFDALDEPNADPDLDDEIRRPFLVPRILGEM